MAVFVVLWPYLLTTKLSCLRKNNFGHTIQYGLIEDCGNLCLKWVFYHHGTSYDSQ